MKEEETNKSRVWQITFFLSIALFIVISILNYPRDPGLTEKAIAKIQFTTDSVAPGFPKTVVFNYDVSKIRATRFEIQPYGDEGNRYELSPLEQVTSALYNYPGYFRANLLVDKQMVKEYGLLIKSGGWFAVLESEQTPRYLQNDEIINKPHLGVSEAVFKEISGSTENPLWLGFYYVEELGEIDCDNFTFETAVKNTFSSSKATCRETRVDLLGTQGTFGVPLSIPGCTEDLLLQFNDVIQEGKNHDLSAFGTEYEGFQILKLEVKDKLATLYLNDQKIHQLEYHEPAGKLAGFRIKFKGAGEVDYVRVKDHTGTLVFEENFGL